MAFTAVELIGLKRDGKKLPPEGIQWLIDAYTDGAVADYQMSAMAMAIVLNGLDTDELAVWTEAMLNSGHVLDFSAIPFPKIDKHSTGGVGDKISIPLAPLVASCGIAIPMISGRALGHTGGTLDKLESIPGFQTALNRTRFREVLEQNNIVMAGQSDSFVPADRKLYALRDTSGTVPSIPLISSSIMAKKLAEGLDGLVLDVKTGIGAFMKDPDDARSLAKTMVGVGERHDVETIAFVTSMDQPLGYEVGNSNEIAESIDVLKGRGPRDVTELTIVIAEAMLEMGGIENGRERLESAIESGAALAKLRDVTVAQGGDASVLDDPSLLTRGQYEDTVYAPTSGFVTRCDAFEIGKVATRLGAGRERQGDQIDHGVGITLHAKIGDKVSAGDPIATVRHSNQARWQAQSEALSAAWTVQDEAVDPPAMVIDRIDSSGE